MMVLIEMIEQIIYQINIPIYLKEDFITTYFE